MELIFPIYMAIAICLRATTAAPLPQDTGFYTQDNSPFLFMALIYIFLFCPSNKIDRKETEDEQNL